MAVTIVLGMLNFHVSLRDLCDRPGGFCPTGSGAYREQFHLFRDATFDSHQSYQEGFQK